MNALAAAGLLLITQAASAADLRVGLYTLLRPSSAVINGEPIRAPVQRRWPAPVRINVPGADAVVLDGPLDVKSTPDGRLSFVHTLPLESYVAGVLAGEASTSDPDEYLKALAIAIRTYAIFSRANHAAHGFELCDTTHCQDLRLSAVQARHRAITEETAGLMLWRNGALTDARYHAHCGGVREGAGPDAYCTWQGNDSWQMRLTDPVEVVDRTATGRVRTVRVKGRLLSGEQFMSAYGVKSLLFDVRGNMLTGRGRGHGLGLCQVGARRMAALGKTSREILNYYYPGTVTGLTAAGIDWQLRRSARLDAFTTQPARDAALIDAAEQALRDGEQRTGLVTKERVRLRIYPTVALFRDSTGASGTVAAVTRGRTIHVQPAGAGALRHEMIHVLLEEHAAAGHPWWFREGFALVLAGDPPSRDARYEDARRRVSALIARYGRDGVLRFWRQGLPAEIARER